MPLTPVTLAEAGLQAPRAVPASLQAIPQSSNDASCYAGSQCYTFLFCPALPSGPPAQQVQPSPRRQLSWARLPGTSNPSWVSNDREAPGSYRQQHFRQASQCPEQTGRFYYSQQPLLFHQLHGSSHFNKQRLK